MQKRGYMEEERKEIKLLNPKLDYVFKRIFGYVGNEEITENLLNSILENKISKIELDKNPILEKDLLNDKIGIFGVPSEKKTISLFSSKDKNSNDGLFFNSIKTTNVNNKDDNEDKIWSFRRKRRLFYRHIGKRQSVKSDKKIY